MKSSMTRRMIKNMRDSISPLEINYKLMKKRFILLSLCLVSITYIAWQNDIEAETRKILGAEVNGFKLRLDDDKALVETLWNEFAKEWGKPEKSKDYQVYETNPWKEPTIIYTFHLQISKRPGHTALWLGLDPEKIKRDEYADRSAKVKDILREFGRSVTLYKIQKQIEEAEQATAFLSKQYDQLKKNERTTAKNQELNLERLEKYKKDVITLQTDSAKYVTKMSELSTSIDSVYKEMEALKKIMEMQRERLKKVE